MSNRGNLRQHNYFDSAMTDSLLKKHPEWSMEVIREAALICSNTILFDDRDLLFVKPNIQLEAYIDNLCRDVAVTAGGIGFNTKAQKLASKAAKWITLWHREHSKEANLDKDTK